MHRIADYELVERLAQGAFGAVFRAVDPEGRPVALKLLQASKGSALERFQREASCLVRLRHPNVVGALDAGVDEGRPYLALELVEGESLTRYVSRVGPLSPEETVTIGMKLASALTHVHEQGLVHRDVKPDNVLLDDEGEPRLTDFGLAHDVESVGSERLTRSGVCLGTPGYWPPEQAAGELSGLGPTADVYALGATLWALLSGQPPFNAASFAESVRRTLRDPPEPPSSRRPEVPPGLDAVILRCMAKDPERRYATAEELEAALATCLTARPAGARLVRGLLAAAVVLTAVAGVAVTRMAGRRGEAPPGPGVAASPGGTPAPVSTAPQVAQPASDGAPTAEDGEPAEVARVHAPPDPDLAAHRARIAAGDRPGAVAALDALLLRRPELLAARLDRAILQLQADDLTGAERTLEEALARSPDLSETLLWRSLVRARRGRPEQALEDLARVVERDADFLAPHARGPWLAFAVPDAARDELTKLLDLSEPARASGYVLRGLLRTLRRDGPGAEHDAQRALELGAPDEAGARAVLAEGLWLQNRGPQAREAWNRALELDPACQRALHDLAGALREAKQPREALPFMDRLVALASGSEHYLFERAQTLALVGDEDAAERDLVRLLELHPSSIKGLVLRSRLHSKRGAHLLAAADLERAVELAPQEATPAIELIDELIALDRLDEALLRVERLAELEGQRARARFLRARVLRAKGDQDLVAIEAELAELARLNPRNGTIWNELGYVRLALGQREPAIDALTRATKIEGETSYARVFLAAAGGDDRPLRPWLKRPGWPLHLARYLLRELGEAQLFELAGQGDERRVREQRCEAWCYSGMRAEVAGEAPRARRCYEECLATGVKRFPEWQHARDRLRVMGEEVR